MELDDFKKAGGKGMKPESMANDAGDDPMGSLIEEMKEKDARERKALLYIIMVFAIFVLIYVAGMNAQKGTMRTGYALLAGGFGISMLFFLLKFLKQKNISYTAPTLIFLKAAERRYAYWTWQELAISIPLVLIMGWGGGLIVFSSFEKYFPGSMIPVLTFAGVFLAALGTGFWAGRSQWEKHKRSVYDKVRRMRQEFGE